MILIVVVVVVVVVAGVGLGFVPCGRAVVPKMVEDSTAHTSNTPTLARAMAA